MALSLQAVQHAFADRYAIERALGRGGMATVFLGRATGTQRAVAVKVLHPEFAISVGVARFRREMHILASLDHASILPMIDSGSAGSFIYYAMPLAEGGTLAGRLSQQRRLPLSDTIAIARQVAAALDHAHARNVIHRDIKPDNIMFEGTRALVADFGVARAVERAAGDVISSSGLIVGTPAYMSPEQAAGEVDLDHRTDIYALACVVFEMLAGEPPFAGRTAQIVMSRHVHEPPPSVCILRPDLPATLDHVLKRGLAKEPADRPASARELVEAMSRP